LAGRRGAIYIKRSIEKTILGASESYSAVIVNGPRQIGKTTTLRHLSGTERGYATLDSASERKMAQSDPELFLSVHPAPLLIDEVQYAPELFSCIKIEIDKGAKPGSYWLTGSQTFRLMRLAQESLAGRVAILRMSGLSQREIYGGENKPFDLDFKSLQERGKDSAPTGTRGQYERIWNGSLPGLVSGKFPDRDIFYGSYLQSYVERDVADLLTRVDALLFSDFIRAAACRAGQMLNIHDIGLDAGLTDDTAKRWLAILEKSGIIFYLRPYSNNLLKRTVKTPKMYFFDTGLVAYLTKYTSPDILMNGAMNGAILENYVVSELMKSCWNAGKECIAHYYRDKDAKEIDIVLESDGELHPIEIKKAASPPPEIARTFGALDSSSLPRGLGAVICTKREFSALDRNTPIVPIWTI
jgi:predicted AAA+ superfamily ATPase